jgi:hypothetical protein
MASSQLNQDDPPRALVLGVVALSLLLGACLAWAGRGDVLLYGDEYLSIPNLMLSWGEVLGTYDDRGTGVGFLLLQS